MQHGGATDSQQWLSVMAVEWKCLIWGIKQTSRFSRRVVYYYTPLLIAETVIPHSGGLSDNRACSGQRKQYADLIIKAVRGLTDNIIVTEERKQYADLIIRAVRGIDGQYHRNSTT
jgi:hypothetical protein